MGTNVILKADSDLDSYACKAKGYIYRPRSSFYVSFCVLQDSDFQQMDDSNTFPFLPCHCTVERIYRSLDHFLQTQRKSAMIFLRLVVRTAEHAYLNQAGTDIFDS